MSGQAQPSGQQMAENDNAVVNGHIGLTEALRKFKALHAELQNHEARLRQLEARLDFQAEPMVVPPPVEVVASAEGAEPPLRRRELRLNLEALPLPIAQLEARVQTLERQASAGSSNADATLLDTRQRRQPSYRGTSADLVHQCHRDSNERTTRKRVSSKRAGSNQPSGAFSMGTAKESIADDMDETVPGDGADMPMSYEDAIDRLGGQEKVEEYRSMSEMLERKHSPDDAKLVIFPAEWHKRLANSIKVNFQVYIDNLDELMEMAEDVHKDFERKIQEIGVATGGKCVVPELKSRERSEAKSRFKYADGAGGVSWFRLTDVVRGTMIYNTVDAMYSALKELEEDTDLQIVEYNDRYLKPLHGYRDLQLVVRFKGVMCELQLNTFVITWVKDKSGHRSFEVRREVQAAAASGEVERCRKILEWGMSNLGSKAAMDLPNIMSGVLHESASRGHAEMVYVFLQYRADANTLDKKRRTPLHDAMSGGHERVAWALLSRGGANLELCDDDGIPPLVEGLLMLRTRPDDERAARTVSILTQRASREHVNYVQTKLKEVLQRKYTNSTDLVQECFDGNVRKIQKLLRDFADPNSKNMFGRPALHCAVDGRNVEAVSLLLTASGDANIKEDKFGITAVQLAFDEKLVDIASVLLSKGGEVPKTLADTFYKGDVSHLRIAGGKRQRFQYMGVALGRNGLLYCAPFDSACVLVIKPGENTTTLIPGCSYDENKYSGIALGLDGWMYCAPHYASKVLAINPQDASVAFVPGAGVGPAKYHGIALAGNGRLYCAPFNATTVLIIDPQNNRSVDFIPGVGAEEDKYCGIALASDGCLYCAPYDARHVLVINPSTNAISWLNAEAGDSKLMAGKGKYTGITDGGDGLLYCSPHNARHVLVINPKDKSLSFIDGVGSEHDKYFGIAVGRDGLIYCAPLSAHKVLVINPNDQSLKFISGDAEAEVNLRKADKFAGIASSLDGKLYCAPHCAIDALVISRMMATIAAQIQAWKGGAGERGRELADLIACRLMPGSQEAKGTNLTKSKLHLTGDTQCASLDLD